MTVPTKINKPIKMTNICINIGGTLSAKTKNGFVEIIMIKFPSA